MAFCGGCGTQIADGTTMCAACSAKAAPAGVAQSSAGGLTDNIAGLLCYSPVGLIADIVFLVAEPYNRNKFIRFHAFQSLFTGAAVFALSIVIMIVVSVLAVIPVVGWIVGALIWAAFCIGNLVLWVLMMIKAYQMQTYKLPYVGDLAAKQAGL